MKKFFIYALVSLMLFPTLMSCANNGETPDENNTENPSTPAADETAPEETEMTLEVAKNLYTDRDYGGYEFRIADRADPGTYADWQTFDVYASEMTGEIINDSVYSRNLALEDAMNIKIVERAFTHGAVTSSVKTSILANTDDYDCLTDGLSVLAPLATSHYVLDFRTIETINCENEWWDQMLYKDLSILNKSFFMTGDISVMDNYGTWCYLFNKSMISDFQLENPYELVDSGKWTLDKHNEMAAVATIDADGDGKWTMEDTYGFITEGYNTGALWNCFGFKIASKDADDLPYFTYEGEEQVTALQAIVNTQQAPFSNMGSKSTVTGGGSFEANTRENQFAIGRALFYYAGMRNITLFRSAETDFGILPAPKYNEEQSKYYSSYSSGNCTAYSIPITVADPAKVGDIMEAMAHLSVYTLTPAYYDYTLIGKSTRDVESEPMIALILSTRNYDLGNVFDWGGVFGTITGLSSPDNVASTLAKTKKPANKVLQKFIEGLITQ